MSLLDAFLEIDGLAAELKQILDGTPPSGLAELFLAIRNDCDPESGSNPNLTGSGTRYDPFTANTAAQFNFVLFTYARAKNMTIHLGPGLFRTVGGSDSIPIGATPNPFRLFDGLRIVGSGMFNTVLRLTARTQPTKLERVISVIGGVLGDTTKYIYAKC